MSTADERRGAVPAMIPRRPGRLAKYNWIAARAAWTIALHLVLSTTISRAAELTVGAVRIGAPGDVGIRAEMVERHKLQLLLPADLGEPVEVTVQLPEAGPESWPVEDVVVRDRAGRLVAATHPGTEWHRFSFPASCEDSPYMVELSGEDFGQRPVTVAPEIGRAVRHDATGLEVAVCKWFHGREAALCLRFDDSHPSHLATVLPVLDKYGFRATFMVNPGSTLYERHRAEWEAVARSGRHELANHTMHHRGAGSDEEAEREIGDAATYLQSLLPPARSKLLALNLGGGTKWTVARPLRYYLAKYCCFLVSGSLGMDDSYGNRVQALREHIEASIRRGGWCKAHWHYVGEGLSTSTENFRAEMEVVAEHRDRLWICGLSEAYKYQTERAAAALQIKQAEATRWILAVTCATDAALFDQPLTIAVSGPAELIAKLQVRRQSGAPIDVSIHERPDGKLAMFDVPPVSAAYEIVAQ